MYRAIEALGRKLERAEEDRARLTQRLTLIELSTERDPVTGKVYLPARIEPGMAMSSPASRWQTVTTVMSCALAILALLVVVFQGQPQDLTPQQVAAINKMMSLQLARLERGPSAAAWRDVDDEQDNTIIVQSVTPVRIPDVPEIKPVIIAAPGAIGPFPMITTVPEHAVAVIAAQPPVTQDIIIPGEDDAVASQDKISVPQNKAAPLRPADKAPVAESSKAVPETVLAMSIKPDAKLSGALKELEKRAFGGVPEAQHDLATMYASGQGMKKDYKRAAFWFFQAADAGIANAHYNLGVMFQQGLGVNKDFQKSLRWYESAARLDHPEAMYNLGIAYVEGVNGVRDLDRGVAYFKRAANAGVSQAAFNLGVLYESGFVGPIDRARALDWYRVAADNGHAEAEDAVTRLDAQMAVAGAGALDATEPAAGETYGEGDASQVGDERKISD
jgi:TPR repeat protein